MMTRAKCPFRLHTIHYDIAQLLWDSDVCIYTPALIEEQVLAKCQRLSRLSFHVVDMRLCQL